MGGNKCWISKRKYLKDLWLRILGPKMLDTATRLRSSQGKALLIFGDVYYKSVSLDNSLFTVVETSLPYSTIPPSRVYWLLSRRRTKTILPNGQIVIALASVRGWGYIKPNIVCPTSHNLCIKKISKL